MSEQTLPSTPAPPAHAAGESPRSHTVLDTVRRIVAVLVLLLVVGGGYWFFQHASHAPTAEAPPPGPAPVVQTVVVQPSTIPLAPDHLGQTEASQVVQIRARVNGFLEAQSFVEGGVVEANDVLFQIDPRSFQAELEVAQSNLKSAEATHAQARQDLQQVEQLRERNAATQQELEDAQTAERVAAAQVEVERARVKQAQLDVDYTTVRSPIRGVIGESQQDVGAYVGAGVDSLLAVVSQVDPIYVRFSISETEGLRWQARVDAGEISMPDIEQLDVAITLSDGRGYELPGKINFVDVVVDPTTGTQVLRATVPNPDMKLRPGQFVHATVRGAERTNAVLIPQAAVMQMPTGASVYVVDAEGKAAARPVELGAWYEDQWIVEKGLSPGDRVIVDQLLKVRPGSPVQLAENANPAPTPAAPGPQAAAEH